MKSKGRPGPIRTNLAQRCPDKNPIFGIRAFLLLPGVLLIANLDSRHHRRHPTRQLLNPCFQHQQAPDFSVYFRRHMLAVSLPVSLCKMRKASYVTVNKQGCFGRRAVLLTACHDPWARFRSCVFLPAEVLKGSLGSPPLCWLSMRVIGQWRVVVFYATKNATTFPKFHFPFLAFARSCHPF